MSLRYSFLICYIIYKDSDIFTTEDLEDDRLQITISELVKQEPTSINELIGYMRQRIFVESNPYLTENDQEEMVRYF